MGLIHRKLSNNTGSFKRQEEETKKTENERYMDYISRVVLPSLREEKIHFLNCSQRVFTIRDAKHYHLEISRIYASMIENMPVKELIYLDENSRRYADYFWSEKIEWKLKRLKRDEMPYISDKQYAAALCVGTFHTDGYCRQVCVKELKNWENSLPYLILRLNDWVSEIRNSAFESALYRISVCGLKELFSALPMLDKVKNSGRWEQPQVNEAERMIKQQMGLKFSECKVWEIPRYEITVKNAIYRFINQNAVLDLLQLEQLLSLEKDSFGKQLLVQAIFKQFDYTKEKIAQYLSDKSSIVRYHSLNYYYMKCQDVWDGLERMLLDKSKKIRDNAAYILKKHSNFDVLGFYKEHLNKGMDKIALLGIGENGGMEEVGLVNQYLNEKEEPLKKEALRAYGMLSKERGEDTYWKFLQDSSRLLFLQAYRLAVKYDVRFGAEKVYGLYKEYKGLPEAEYLIRLLLRESSWKRLPYLLLLYDEESLSENIRSHIYFAINSRSMYGKITKQESQFIMEILDEKQECLPEKMVKSILWELKYVVG